MHSILPAEHLLVEAFSVIEETAEIEQAVAKLRDLLGVDHVVYHSSKLEASPLIPYIRLTYPAAWIKRYLQMGYGEVDPIVREGFKRALPFDWKELAISSPAEKSFLLDAAAHGIGPHGFSVPVVSKHGYRGLFTVSSSLSEREWATFISVNQKNLVQIAHRLHSRVVVEVFGSDHPRLTARELECLRWIALGKDASEIATILNISPHTTRDYLKSVHYKLDCATSAQAVSKAIRLGLLTMYK
jgi:LuxR family transcriptional regulator, quorum-sensing system regulator CinR